MVLPFLPKRSIQAYQIFAANTNVGKTILATGLCRAAGILADQTNKQVVYVKPVQTGYPADSDERHVRTFAPRLSSSTLYTYSDPVSPHIATNKPPSDRQVLDKIKQSLNDAQLDSRGGSYVFLETAGGVHSPVMSGTSQADFYRELRLPTLLVGDGQLGGISTTLTAFEAMRIRGYDIPCVLMFNNDRYQNHTLVQQRLKDDVHVVAVNAPPAKIEDQLKDVAQMAAYYDMLDEQLVPVIKHLDEKHEQRFERLEQMAQTSRDIFWWPFTQHEHVKEVTVIDSAYKDYFTTYTSDAPGEGTSRQMFDSCASWWTQGMGHGNPNLTLAAASAAGRYGHVIFPEAAYEPAMSLAEKVLSKDQWASRVFFSDNGSTAIEVGMKMGLSAAARRYGWSPREKAIDVLGIEGSYHGDTIGAMDASPPNVYNDQVQWYEPRGHWLTPPSVHVARGEVQVRVPSTVAGQADSLVVSYPSIQAVYSVDQPESRDPSLTKVYTNYIRSELDKLRQQGRRVGALLMEPVIMGAGGMVFVDPLFQRTLVDVVRKEGAERLGYQASDTQGWQGLPVIFDEVFTGWYRLGRRSASDFLGTRPDIVAYAKTMTGGLLPLALTVAKEAIFDVFLSSNKPDCLLHGHSYTAHPMGCAVANETIDSLDRLAADREGGWAPFRKSWSDSSVWSMWSPETVHGLSHMDAVESCMALGSVLAVELKVADGKGYSSMGAQEVVRRLRYQPFAQGINLFTRPLGHVVYLMTSQITSPEDVRQCEDILKSCLQTL